MKDETRHSDRMRRRLIGLAMLSSLILLPSFLRADSIFVEKLERPSVVIKDLKGDQLHYEINGKLTALDVSKITRLVVQSEPPLTDAEAAYAGGKWDQAVDNYLKSMRTTRRDWVKSWSAMRLVEAANKSGRFDAAVNAYIVTLMRDPAAAGKLRPVMPDSNSTFLESAVKDVNAALGDPKLSVEQKRALLGFLVELQQARKDSAGEDAAYEQMMRLPGADLSDPTARRTLARRRLSVAARAIDAKDYEKALAELDAGSEYFTDPPQQADALYLLAEARYGLAGDDKTALADCGLAYMRVVALAKPEPDRPHVVESLLKTARIMERLGEPQTARSLYEQVLAQYPDDPAAPQARQNLDRLKNS